MIAVNVIVILRPALRGGELISDHFYINLPRLKILRTDREHELTRVEEGERKSIIFAFEIGPYMLNPPV